jgi:hypothetical protein
VAEFMDRFLQGPLQQEVEIPRQTVILGAQPKQGDHGHAVEEIGLSENEIQGRGEKIHIRNTQDLLVDALEGGPQPSQDHGRMVLSSPFVEAIPRGRKSGGDLHLSAKSLGKPDDEGIDQSLIRNLT